MVRLRFLRNKCGLYLWTSILVFVGETRARGDMDLTWRDASDAPDSDCPLR